MNPCGNSRQATDGRGRSSSHTNTLWTSGVTKGLGEGDTGVCGESGVARYVGSSGRARQDLRTRDRSRSKSSKKAFSARDRPAAHPSPEGDCSLRLDPKWWRCESHADCRPTTTGMSFTLYMDLSLKDWQCAQRTGKVPLGKKGYIRLFEHPISSSGAKSLMSVKVIFSDEGVLTYSQAGTLKKPVLDDGREWRA